MCTYAGKLFSALLTFDTKTREILPIPGLLPSFPHSIIIPKVGQIGVV